MSRGARILLAPVDVGGEASALAAALVPLGLRPTLALARPDPHRSPSFPAVDLSDPARRRRYALAAPFRHDLLHLFFGRTLLFPDGPRGALAGVEPLLFRALRKPVFMTLQGCDARDPGRAPDTASPCRPGACGLFATCRAGHAARRRTLAGAVLARCAAVFCLNPDLVPFSGPRARFLPYAGIDVAAMPSVAAPRADGPLRILHAPTDRGIKGTRLLEAAVGHLAASHEIEFTLVEGVSRAETLERIARADLVIDQVRVGWYGSLAVEAMALGRPVAAFLREADLIHLPRAMRESLPILRVHPDTLSDDLARIARRRSEFAALGEASRAFAREWHDPARIAREVAGMYAAALSV